MSIWFVRKKIDPEKLKPEVTAKWSKTVLDEGFVPFPKRLLRSMHKLFSGPKGVQELAVLLAIVDYRRKNLSRSPSIEYLAFTAGLTRKRFREILEKLEEKGWVQVENRPREGAIDITIDGFEEEIEDLTRREEAQNAGTSS